MNSIQIKLSLFFLIGTILLFSACGKFVDVNVTVIDQKTALENQILGSYEELGNEMVLLASVRSVDENGKLKQVIKTPPAKLKAIRAMQRMEFNRDDIQKFKEMGIAGEKNDGFLRFFETEKTQKDIQLKAFSQTIINEENEDRETVLNRVIATNIRFSPKDLPKVKKVYANLNRDNAITGEKIQLEDGTWTIKR
jgi:hypothetical protein